MGEEARVGLAPYDLADDEFQRLEPDTITSRETPTHRSPCRPLRSWFCLTCSSRTPVAGARKIAESIGRLLHWGECFDGAKPFAGIPTEVR